LPLLSSQMVARGLPPFQQEQNIIFVNFKNRTTFVKFGW
jgi:hypothetical protein